MTAVFRRSGIAALARGVVLLAALSAASTARATLPIQSWTLPNGARVLFVENRALPIVDISIDFPAGSSRDEPDRTGVASMTLGMMRLGAGGIDESGIASRLADVGGQIGSRFDADRAGYSLRSLSSAEELGEGLQLLAAIVQDPAFPAEVLEREKARLIAGLTEANSKPESIAERAFYGSLYGTHPYGQRGSGEIATVGAVGVADLRSFYAKWFRADWAVVAIMGDVSREQADEMARRVTARLPRSAASVPPLPAVVPLEGPIERRIAHPAAQSHLLMGQPGMTRNDPDYFPLFVGNYDLGGGGFASRLVDEVRQKRGLAYSSYSFFSALAEKGVFQVGLQTKKEQADQALEVVRNTLRKYVVDGPTEQELAAAKQNLIGGFPLRIDSNKKIHDYLALIGFYRLPLDYLDLFVREIDAVTVLRVRDAFRRRVDPERMVTVIVGGAPAAQ